MFLGKDEIYRLLSIAKKWPNCMIIADEIYDGLDFTGQYVSVASLSSEVPVFVLNESLRYTMRRLYRIFSNS